MLQFNGKDVWYIERIMDREEVSENLLKVSKALLKSDSKVKGLLEGKGVVISDLNNAYGVVDDGGYSHIMFNIGRLETVAFRLKDSNIEFYFFESLDGCDDIDFESVVDMFYGKNETINSMYDVDNIVVMGNLVAISKDMNAYGGINPKFVV